VWVYRMRGLLLGETDLEDALEELFHEISLREYVLLKALRKAVQELKELNVENPLDYLLGILDEAIEVAEMDFMKYSSSADNAVAAINYSIKDLKEFKAKEKSQALPKVEAKA
jgi:hypothetical protein